MENYQRQYTYIYIHFFIYIYVYLDYNSRMFCEEPWLGKSFIGIIIINRSMSSLRHLPN